MPDSETRDCRHCYNPAYDCTGMCERGKSPQQFIQTGKTFPGGAPDQETHDLMAALSDLQTWTVLLATKGVPKAAQAMDLVQQTRAFIVSRVFPANKDQGHA